MADLNLDTPMPGIGQVQWHGTDEDGGPDVGMLIGLSADHHLWLGERSNSEGSGMGMLVYGPTSILATASLSEYDEIREVLEQYVAPALKTLAEIVKSERRPDGGVVPGDARTIDGELHYYRAAGWYPAPKKRDLSEATIPKYELPKRSECKCICHDKPGVFHMTACCVPDEVADRDELLLNRPLTMREAMALLLVEEAKRQNPSVWMDWSTEAEQEAGAGERSEFRINSLYGDNGGALDMLGFADAILAPALSPERIAGAGQPIDHVPDAGKMVSVPLATMNAIHTELACGMAFLGRGPGGTNADHIDRWAKLCSEVADGLAKADALVRPIVHPQ